MNSDNPLSIVLAHILWMVLRVFSTAWMIVLWGATLGSAGLLLATVYWMLHSNTKDATACLAGAVVCLLPLGLVTLHRYVNREYFEAVEEEGHGV